MQNKERGPHAQFPNPAFFCAGFILVMHQQARLHALWKINCHYTLNFIFVGFVFLNSHSEKYFFGNKRLQLCIDKFMVCALVIASLCFLCKHFLHTFVVP